MSAIILYFNLVQWPFYYALIESIYSYTYSIRHTIRKWAHYFHTFLSFHDNIRSMNVICYNVFTHNIVLNILVLLEFHAVRSFYLWLISLCKSAGGTATIARLITLFYLSLKFIMLWMHTHELAYYKENAYLLSIAVIHSIAMIGSMWLFYLSPRTTCRWRNNCFIVWDAPYICFSFFNFFNHHFCPTVFLHNSKYIINTFYLFFLHSTLHIYTVVQYSPILFLVFHCLWCVRVAPAKKKKCLRK